jgi:hypothetical protein
VKYSADLVLLAEKETELRGTIDRVINIGKCYGIEINVEKTTVMNASRQPSALHDMTDKKQLDSVEYFNYFGSMIKNDARFTRGIKIRSAAIKASFYKK